MKPASNPNSNPTNIWHIFCKVVDNFGDIGVCWRMACDLASRGKAVRLWVDDASALAWMAPDGCAGVEVIDCKNDVVSAMSKAEENVPCIAPEDVLVDTFGCEFAIYFIATKATNTSAEGKISTQKPLTQPVWLNVEYLTAESFAERNHTLPYVYHSGAAAGWMQRYFYPGFNARTGGLLREMDVFERQKAFDRVAWLSEHLAQSQRRFDEKTTYVSLFCYEPAALEALIDQLTASQTPTCLLVTAGRAAAAVTAVLERKKQLKPLYLLTEQLSILYLSQLTQTDFDHLLWSCDLNFVRGEDSLVRAIWAGKPFVWQIYPQDDGAHHAKLEAFLAMMGAPESLKAAHLAWNASVQERHTQQTKLPEQGLHSFAQLDLSTCLPIWAQSVQILSTKLRQQDDLVTNLLAYAAMCAGKRVG